MKEAFRKQRITEKTLTLIVRSNKILEDYMEQGYKLTLRQLYYQLVTLNIIENITSEYSRLGSTMVTARMNGLVDWDAIEDRIRIPYLPYTADSVEDALQDLIDAYRNDRQEGQPFHMEVWTEKDAVSNILRRCTVKFHLRLMVNRGDSSCSALYEASQRFMQTDKPILVLYAGDHDPSGLDMVRDIDSRLREFGDFPLEVRPVALTFDQIQDFDLPPNPAKITDPRAKWYIKQHGGESWELDALEPEVLHKIMTNAILEDLDLSQYTAMRVIEDAGREELQEIKKQRVG